MSLQQSLKQDATTLASAIQGASGLSAFRDQQQQRLAALDFPDRKTEQWKYTSLRAMESGHLKRALANDESDSPVPDLGAARIVIRNGQLDSALCDALPEGVTLTRLSDAPELAATDMESLFGTINGASLADGLVLTIAANADVATPIHLAHVADADTPGSTQLRVIVRVGTGARVTVIEHYLGQGPALTNAVTRYQVAANAQLTHYRLSSESTESLHVGLLEFSQQRDSRVESFQFMLGCTLRRNDVHVIMAEPGADLSMKGIFIARGDTHIDNQVCVEHRVPHCTSDQVYKGLAGDAGRAVFNGRIHIHEGAKGTNAELSNKNLLLNPGAEIDSKPELEIYNDDVKCAHGSTVGQMDAAQLFYLRSRGIEEHAAKRMLGEGFVNEVVLSVPHQGVRDWAGPWLAAGLTEGL